MYFHANSSGRSSRWSEADTVQEYDITLQKFAIILPLLRNVVKARTEDVYAARTQKMSKIPQENNLNVLNM